MHRQYSMFIGRWQPFHDGHQWLIDQRLKMGKNVLICIRDVEPNEKQPWTSEQIKRSLFERFEAQIQSGEIKVMIIPDIESINYGRDVGYEVIEHVPPQEVKEISATKIREQMRERGEIPETHTGQKIEFPTPQKPKE